MFSSENFAILCVVKTELYPLGNIPVTSKQVASLYPSVKAPNQKIGLLLRDGRLHRLKKGLFVVSEKDSEKPLSLELIANHLCAPSYVSLQTALRYYGLIPEYVTAMQSMTLKSSQSFENDLGYFIYHHLSREAFAVGVCIVTANGVSWTMATPEKALCDLIAVTPGVNLRYLKDVGMYLEEDLRFDMEALKKFDVQILSDYAKVGKKAQSIQTLIKFLAR